MNYSGIIHNDVCNGDGVRVTLFVSGCTNNCKGCHNPETHDFNYGKEFDDIAKDEIERALQTNMCDGLTLSGGDPLAGKNCTDSFYWWLKHIKKTYPNKTIWAYTGIIWETLSDHDVVWDTVRECIDVLVDGRYIEELADKRLLFRGSSNQRIIDVKKSVSSNKVVLWNPVEFGHKSNGHKLSISHPMIKELYDYICDITNILDIMVIPCISKLDNPLKSVMNEIVYPLYTRLTDIQRELSIFHLDAVEIESIKSKLDSIMIDNLIKIVASNLGSVTIQHELTIMLRNLYLKFDSGYSDWYRRIF